MKEVRVMRDKIGFGFSGLCLIHCLLLPFVVAALPWLGSLFEDERIHLAFAAVTVSGGLLLISGHVLNFGVGNNCYTQELCRLHAG